jgi:predicted nucleic acid-binding protein
MSATKVFFDTNLLVYAHVDSDSAKHGAAREFLRTTMPGVYAYVSTQVLNEFYVALQKYLNDHRRIVNAITEIVDQTNVVTLSMSTLERCYEIKERYGFSYWDSLIIASALNAGCTVLYTEDMQDKQLIESSLLIINPFSESS